MTGGAPTASRRVRTSRRDRLLLAAFGLFSLAGAGSFLGRHADLFELASHFRVQFAIAAFVFALVFALRGARLPAVAAALLLVAHGLPLWPYLAAPSPATAPASAPTGRPLVLMAANLHGPQGDMEEFEAQLDLVRPDMVFMADLPPDIRRRMRDWKDRYPWQVYGPRSRHVRAILLMSRVPIVDSRLEFENGPWAEPIIEAHLCRDGRADGSCLSLVGLHPANPLKSRAQRDDHLARAVERAEAAEAAGARTVLLGDLNLTPWSSSWHDIVGASGLRDAALGFGLRATWASRFAPFGLAIDHVLVGPGVVVTDFRVGADFRSDHLPVIAEIALPAMPAQSAGAALRNTSRAAP